MAETQVFPVQLPDGRIFNVEAESAPTKNDILRIQEAVGGMPEPQRSISEAIATGAGMGAAPAAAFLKTLGTTGRALAGTPLPVRIGAPLVAGMGAAALTAMGQRKLLEQFSPATLEAAEEMAATRPISTAVGSAITSGFRPGGIAAGGLRKDLLERLPATALGGGIQAGAEAFQMEDGELPAGAGARIAEAALLNAILNRETAYGRALIGPAPVVPVQAPRTRPATPVTDNLGQVKAGESLPSATAKANQMATGGAKAAPSPTQELKQTKAAVEAQTRQKEQLLRNILGDIGTEEVTPRTNIPGGFGSGTGTVRTGGSSLRNVMGDIGAGEVVSRPDIAGGFGSGAETGRLAEPSSTGAPEAPAFRAGEAPRTAEESTRAFTEQPLAPRPAVESASEIINQQFGGRTLEESYNLAEDLLVEYQNLTGRSRESILNEAKRLKKTEVEDLVPWLQGEVAFKKNPLIADVDRRINELEAQVRGTEARAERQIAETIERGEAQRGMERAMERETVAAQTGEVAPTTVAPEAGVADLEGFMQRPAMVTPERNVEVQIIEQNRRNRERIELEKKARSIEQDLLSQGVDILPEQARELARMPAAQFNAARQRIIDSVRFERQGPAQRRPVRIKGFEEITPEVILREQPAPQPAAEVQAPASAQARPVTPEGPLARVLEAPAPVPAPTAAPEVKPAPAPTPEAPRAVKATETAKDEATRLGLELAFNSRRLADAKSGKLGKVTKKEIAQLEKTTDQVRNEFLAKSDEARALEQAPEAPAAAPKMSKEDADLNARIDKTIEELDLARTNLEPLSKIIRILTKSKLLSEGDISQIRGAGKSMGPEDAATEAASILEFKRPEPPVAGAEVAAKPEVTTPAPAAPAPAAEAPAQVKPKATKEQRVAAIKERLAATTRNKRAISEIDENVTTTASEAVSPDPVPTEMVGPKTQQRTVTIKETKTGWRNETTGETYDSATKALNSIQKADRESATRSKGTPIVTLINWQPTTNIGTAAVRTISGAKAPINVEVNKVSEVKGSVFDKPYSFYKKEEGIGVPWFAEINGVEYPLKAMSLGNAKTEAKRLASEKLRPTGGPETLGILPRRMPSVGEPLAGAAIGYAMGDTDEERKQNALLGFQLGSLASLAGTAAGRMAAGKPAVKRPAPSLTLDINSIPAKSIDAVPAQTNRSGQLLAPNGQPSRLTERQWKATRTKEFKDWFGDWENDPANASGVVDANGEPLVVYHGTKNIFKGFDRTEAPEATRDITTYNDIMSAFGDHFAASPEVASRFAMGIYDTAARGGTPNVQPVFLNIKRIKNVGSETEFKFDLESKNISTRTVDDILMNEAAPEEVLVTMPGEQALTAAERIAKYDSDPNFRREINRQAIAQERNLDEPITDTNDALVAAWKKDNPDAEGIMYMNEASKETRGVADTRAFIIFKGNQAKSIFNRGTYSPNDFDTLNAVQTAFNTPPKAKTAKEIKDMPIDEAPQQRASFISSLLDYQKAPPQAVYDNLVAEAKINNTGAPTPEVASHIANAPIHHQKMLSDLASAFPSLTKIPGGQTLSDAIGGAAKIGEKLLGTAVSNIAARSPRAAGAINTLFYEKGKQQIALWESGGAALNDFTKTKLSQEESARFWRLARNGNVDEAKQILNSVEGGADAVLAYDQVLQTRREIRQSAKELGIEMGDIGDALPSIVADVDGLLKELGVEARGRFGKMLNDARKSKSDDAFEAWAKEADAAREAGKPIPPKPPDTLALSTDEEIAVMSQFLTGIRAGVGKPGFMKGRTIKELDETLDKYYAPGAVALKRYYDRWVDYKLNKQFFGKTRPDMTPNEPIGGNVAEILVEDYKQGKIGEDELKRLQQAIRSLFQFDWKHTNNIADKLRKTQTFALLSDVSTAVIQFADLFTMAYAYGGPKGIFNAFKPSGRINLKDINVLENSNVDVEDITKGPKSGSRLGRVVTAAYEAPLKYLLGATDKINKEGLINSAKNYVADVVNKPDSRQFRELEEYYSSLYPERWPKILADLRDPKFRKGELTDNTQFFLRNELAKYQPIDLATRAEGYASAGAFGKMMYTLRSYAIKQLDIIRRDVYDNVKKANQTGDMTYLGKGIANMAMYAALVGAGQQVFRYGIDTALDRKTESPEEYAIQGAMGIMLIPRYSIYRLGEEGLFVAAAEWAVPGSGILNDLSRDVQTVGKYLGGQRDVQGFKTVPNIESFFKQAESVKFIPGIGRELYWWFGKGQEKTRKLEEEALMGKERPGTLETISNIIFPPDLKTSAR